MIRSVLTIVATAILVATVIAGDFPLPCRFMVDLPDLSKVPNCAKREDAHIVVSKAALESGFFFEHGLARALIDHTWYYIKRDGTTLAVITFDNGPDDFAEGLTRSRINDKIAYFDRQFKQVIPPKYDWGWPFENGKALVCVGCKEHSRHGDEHRRMEGGR